MIDLKQLDEKTIQEDVNLVEENYLIYRGFDSRPWEGCPPLTTELDNLVREYLPEEKKKDLDRLLYGAFECGPVEGEMPEFAICVSQAEDLAWDFNQIKKSLKEWLYLLLR
jgi:hypothetical protein